MTHCMARKVRVRVKDIRRMAKLCNGHWAGFAGSMAMSAGLSTLVFGRMPRFNFGGTYGFGLMCYAIFGLISVLTESEISAFD